MNDNQAINEIDLGTLIEQIPLGYCVVADAAYAVSERLVPMFYGADKLNPRYNFFGSQLRIRTEMAFGMMTCKWGIYWCQLLVGLNKIKYIVEVIGRLHNFCNNERIGEVGPGCDPVVEANVQGIEIYQDMAKALAEYKALTNSLHSGKREDMPRCIESMGLSREKLA
jgi:DDE superfamily endonuclease